MKSETGSLLMRVAGYIFSVFGGVCFFIILALMDLGSNGGGGYFNLFTIIIIFIFFIFLGLVYLFFLSSKWMKESEKVRKGAILAIILGVLTFSFIGLLCIIAGIIGLRDFKK